MGLGVYISCELKRLRRGGEAKASLKRAISIWYSTRSGGDLAMTRLKHR